MKRVRIGTGSMTTAAAALPVHDPVTSRLNALSNVPVAAAVVASAPAPDRVKRPRVRLAPPSVAHTVEEEQLDETERIKRRAQEAGRPPEDVVITPSATSVIAQCTALPWYVAGQRFVAGSEHYDYPIVHVLSRAWLQQFLREPWTNKGERPCFNLDRDPLPNEGKLRCVAHKQFGFRCRELLFDASPVVSTVPELCYLCHLYMYMLESIAQRSVPRDTIYIVNKFMVIVGRPGEYAEDKMLTDDTGKAGLWGHVPIYNENNYVLGPLDNGLRTIKETDNLLFRLTRAPLQQTESVVSAAAAEGRVSIRSSRTNVGSLSTTTRHP